MVSGRVVLGAFLFGETPAEGVNWGLLTESKGVGEEPAS